MIGYVLYEMDCAAKIMGAVWIGAGHSCISPCISYFEEADRARFQMTSRTCDDESIRRPLSGLAISTAVFAEQAAPPQCHAGDSRMSLSLMRRGRRRSRT